MMTVGHHKQRKRGWEMNRTNDEFADEIINHAVDDNALNFVAPLLEQPKPVK